MTGGGGYTKENVARCWTVETGVLLDTELPNGKSSNFYSRFYVIVYEMYCDIYFRKSLR